MEIESKNYLKIRERLKNHYKDLHKYENGLTDIIQKMQNYLME